MNLAISPLAFNGLNPHASSQPDSTNPFFMGRSDWLDIQLYAQNGRRLPSNEAAFRSNYHIPDDQSLTPFSDIQQAFSEIHQHCCEWLGVDGGNGSFSNGIYDGIVDLARDIYHYSQSVETYYQGLSKIVARMEDEVDQQSPSFMRLQAKFDKIIDKLIEDAESREHKAEAARSAVSRFKDNTQNDRERLKTAHKALPDILTLFSERNTALEEKITILSQSVSNLNEAYNKAVVVAATTPTYALLLPPLGLIAAATVAGIYGDQAVKLKNQKEQVEQQAEDVRRELEKNRSAGAALQISISSIDTESSGLLDNMEQALLVLGKVKGFWNATASDLRNIKTVLQQDVKSADVLLKEFGIDDAISKWQDLGANANAFSANAYIDVQNT